MVNESYPEPNCIKDGNSDYQAQKSVIWTSQMGKVVHTKEKLVDEMESNDFDPNDSDLRRGDNVIQGLISNKKRKRNRTPITPLGLKRILEGSPGDEGNTEGSDSDSPAFNPTLPPSTVESTESYRTSPPSTVKTTESIREPEPAVDFESEERTDMSMFIAPIVMNSAQVAQSKLDGGLRSRHVRHKQHHQFETHNEMQNTNNSFVWRSNECNVRRTDQ